MYVYLYTYLCIYIRTSVYIYEYVYTFMYKYIHMIVYSYRYLSISIYRAKDFAGTYYSTFTGYIHRLRGYHGLGENTYYHTTGAFCTYIVVQFVLYVQYIHLQKKCMYICINLFLLLRIGRVFHAKMEKSVGNGFSREWRAGWTDDGGELI
jgi:hypothetical protein